MMARRYHKLPTEILELDLEDIALNFAVMQSGIENDSEELRELASRNKDAFFCPAWLLLMR